MPKSYDSCIKIDKNEEEKPLKPKITHKTLSEDYKDFVWVYGAYNHFNLRINDYYQTLLKEMAQCHETFKFCHQCKIIFSYYKSKDNHVLENTITLAKIVSKKDISKKGSIFHKIMKFFNKYKLANHQDKNKIQLIPLKRKKGCKIPIEWDNIKPDLNSLLYKDLYTHSLKLEEENQRLLYEKKDL